MNATMSKRNIPVPKRDDEFEHLENELNEAIKSVETFNRAAENLLREFTKSESDETVTDGVDESGTEQIEP